ncbi:hypothetical protein MSAN_00117100 [Mycena sanguinolenta]|uniref:Uncharacterized protein n=1 Tax=Mycena sanguinolenta TaxID=230812 RepID=A0A8H7DKR0_9AGAR|nr:hypothetical protein MSAN_00117100 [Mycena sanguinolenta]
MDAQSHPNTEFFHSNGCESEYPSVNGMFSHSQKFAVTGKTFTTITNNYAAPSIPSDFWMIPLAGIDLLHEIRLDNSTAAVDHRHKQARVRRLYSAKIEGRNSTLTEWRNDLAKYMSMRHPNIIQICGAASSGGIHATLFNDGISYP